jgi:hypothetical protein
MKYSFAKHVKDLLDGIDEPMVLNGGVDVRNPAGC